MSGWVVALVIGGLVAALLVGLLVVVYRAVVRTAENARELMVALEDVQKHTLVLSDLEATLRTTGDVTADAEWAIRRLAEHEQEKDGRDTRGR